MAISDDDYNTARAILVQAGSRSAGVSHIKHTGGKGSPESHGKDLLREAYNEFNASGTITDNQKTAILRAAKKMDLDDWARDEFGL
jgi:hypothetical protein